MRISALLVLSCTLIVSACVSIDTRSLRERPEEGAKDSIVGTFSNLAQYQSKGEFTAHATLAAALDAQAPGADTVVVSRPTPKALKLEFKQAQETRKEVTYTVGSNLRVSRDGRYQIEIPDNCAGHDSPRFSCGSKTVMLFINEKGQLAAIEKGGGTGALGIIPFFVYARTLAIFAREPAPQKSAQN